jgi:starch-binding outer membrane protein, SusD/RagB family
MNQKHSHIHKCCRLFAVLLVVLHITGCKKFLEVKAPTTRVNEDNVYQSDQTAIAVLTQIYTQMASPSDGGFTGKTGMSVLSGLSSDELTLSGNVTDQRLIAYYGNQLRTNPTENYGTEYWIWSWNKVFVCNAAIDGLNKSSTLTASVKTQLLGEAKFVRALLYFYMVNYYGDVPLVLTTNPNETRILPRSPKQEVYAQMVTDLKDAQDLLSASFLDASLLKSTAERVRPTKWCATALLARTYLYMGEYADAETEASRIIANTNLFSLASLSSVFLRNSTEAIWQLQPVQLNRNTEDAFVFKLPPTGPNIANNPVYLSAQVVDAFEIGDARRKAGGWVDSVISGGNTYFFPTKYRATTTTGSSFTEYLMMFRLAEQYLIRAEARAQQNNINGAKEDLNVIRERVSLPGTTANDQPSLLDAIWKDRQVELFTELGQRWLDLKRTGKVDEVMTIVSPLKNNGGAWNSYQQLYPIMFYDIQKNQNLTQNFGY